MRTRSKSAGYHIREFRVVDGASRRVASFGTSAFRALAGGRFITIERSALSRLIFERASRCSETLLDDEIVGLRGHGDGVEAKFERAGERNFDCVVGADGLHSNVRRLAFGPQERFEKPLGYAVAAFEIDGYRPRDQDIYVVHNEPGWMLGRASLRDDRTLFLFVFADEKRMATNAKTPSDQKAVLHKIFGSGKWECREALAGLENASEFYFASVSQIRMQRWSRGRIALLGDAAFCISLMGGQGSALAMTAAYVLAGELAATDGRASTAFERYEAKLRAYVAAKQKGAARFSAAFAPKTRLGILLRNLTVNASAIPPVARFMMGRELIDRLELPEYPQLQRRAA